MPPKKGTATPIAKTVTGKGEESRLAAIEEIKDLRKDLLALEKALVAKSPAHEYPLLDIVHGAFEIYRHGASYFKGNELLAAMEADLLVETTRADLEKAGAKLLKKPAGWHWISPGGEMHLLGKAGEEAKALEKLKDLKSPSRRKKAAATKKAKTLEPAAEQQNADNQE